MKKLLFIAIMLCAGCSIKSYNVADPRLNEVEKKTNWIMGTMSLKAKYQNEAGEEKEGVFSLMELYKINERTKKKEIKKQ